MKIAEVGLRDGLQAEARVLSTDIKVWALGELTRAGLAEIEATSFVHPRAYPQLADAEDVLARAPRAPGTRLTALVPNLKGAQRALAAEADGLRVVICASETYNRKNVGMSVERSVAVAGEILELASDRGTPVAAAIALAFGCPFEGEVPPARVLALLGRLAEMGFAELCLADSAGLARPSQVAALASEAVAAVSPLPLSLHLHENGGRGLLNVRAGLEAGVTAFDASFGGLGGCPVNPAYTGNVATEAVAELCRSLGIPTGVDSERVRHVTRRVQASLAGEE